MSVEEPIRFLTVAFGTPADIGFLPRTPTGAEGELLTVGWAAKLGTSFLPYDPADAEAGDPRR
ncbi:hypothetical protein LWP59_14390 [Amycolatopsis acidiphila]|uniref:Uncharacterized protein n=1 Tax=Amycolatopsis acidiphila TaxID=715473 RepID=A0A558AKG5_9PSEU|nr:hypothetical protein [Amycolatopsis acidiphila]TVT24756.1 hypothetical protein FNH06_05090 [Amycolatopsis acidiphila]UIJ62725.1 hypothetical protein LWP59_14390 [Amycolatopsis acidiphila]GHG63818.1 hypothetical protein GCM10017788_20020 [Amycolatopsis acidiphila]